MRRLFPLIATLLLLALRIADAATLAPGMPMPPLTLTDQHDAKAAIAPDTRMVIFARDMAAADIVEKALADNGAALLADAAALFVSDISGMPGMVRKFIAMPAMRKRPYRMILDRDGKVTADMPVQKDQVTLLRLDAMTIQTVEYLDSADRLRAALEAARSASP